MPKNHGKRYSPDHRNFIKSLATNVHNRSQLQKAAQYGAMVLERTDVAIAKQIEIELGWFWC